MPTKSFIPLNLEDVKNGLLFHNFKVEDGVPKIETRKTQIGIGKDNLKTGLIDTGKFRKVAEKIFIKLAKDDRVVLVGPRGIGKSTLATYVIWRSLHGSLGNVVLDKPMEAVIRIDSLKPGDALGLNNQIKSEGRRLIIIYDPSPIEAYYEPEAMQVMKNNIEGDRKSVLKELIESVKSTLKELVEVKDAKIIIVLPSELYKWVQRDKFGDENLRQAIDSLESDAITVNLKDEGFLGEVIRKYSECENVSDDLAERVIDFDTYTLVAKYVGIRLREKYCNVEDVDEVLMESTSKPKLFFAHYIQDIILAENMDLVKKVSVPLILHATFGPIPQRLTYISKVVNDGGVWKLVGMDTLAKSRLESLKEDDLKPIAEWLSMRHEDLIEETLKELVGLRGDKARYNYERHGFENLMKLLDWGYEKVWGEVRRLSRGVRHEEVMTNLLIFVGERLKHALDRR